MTREGSRAAFVMVADEAAAEGSTPADRRRAELDRVAAALRTACPIPAGPTFHMGYLCGDEALQARVPRRQARRHAAWLFQPNPTRQRRLARFPAVADFNPLLP